MNRALVALTAALLAACEGEMTGGAAGGSEATAGGSAGGSRAGGSAGGSSGGGATAGGAAGGSSAGGATGTGLAASYRGDVGIENDPDVIWAEHFDEASVTALSARYTQTDKATNLQLVSDAPAGAGDAKALRVQATASSTGGHLYKYFPAGHEELWVRYYIKYVSGPFHHTTVNVGGVSPSAQPFITQGAIGLCCTAPDGDKAFAVSAEVYAPSGGAYPFDFYNYWWEMKSWGAVVTPAHAADEPDPITGQLKLPAAGNSMLVGSEPRLQLGRWYAIELHLKLNTPPQRNGLLGLWVDGQRVQELGPGFPNGDYQGTNFSPSASGSPFPGLSWRSDAALKVNYLWVSHYATQVPAGQTSVVLYDQLVMAKRYIGPIAP